MIRRVDGVVVILAGVAALAAAIGVLRSFGPRFRVGRLLATAPAASVGEAVDLARRGSPAYVRISGRIDSETDFEDAHHRPLVFRRSRFQVRRGRRWSDFEVVREAVPFEIHEDLDAVEVETDDIGDGLVVIRRESIGVLGDLADRAPDDLDRTLPARVLVEQVSSVEHATVVGVPSLGADGRPRIAAGLGRPLILTTLEPDEAMRILADGSSRRPRLAAALLVVAAVLVVVGIVLIVLPGSAFAATPEPTAVTGADTRSSGQGPGLVGAPLVAILGVAGIGILAVLVTLAFVRATGGPGSPDPED
jgi:hypothetical protein